MDHFTFGIPGLSPITLAYIRRKQMKLVYSRLNQEKLILSPNPGDVSLHANLWKHQTLSARTLHLGLDLWIS